MFFAEAELETFFQVYFGDVQTVPVDFMQGQLYVHLPTKL
jgi:hypothetical protein